MSSPADVVARVRDLVTDLEGTDLRPELRVNAAFGELVALTLRHRGSFADDVLRELGPLVRRVQRLCARGESALELHWSERIATASNPATELRKFPYAANYEELVELELAVVRGVGGAPRRVAMIGSGALPLTGIMLAQKHGLEVVLVDRDPVCLRAGAALAESLGVSGRVTSLQADVELEGLELTEVDLVVHAALVGADAAAKRGVLDRISSAMAPGSYLVVRSAAGLRELLYPPATVDGVDGLTMLLELHPHHEVVNSVLVARRESTSVRT